MKERETGLLFPAETADGQHLVGVGVRKKTIIPPINVKVYAIGGREIVLDPPFFAEALRPLCLTRAPREFSFDHRHLR